MTGLFGLGESKGFFEKGLSTDAPFPCTYGDCEGRVNFESWKARTDAGDPTSPEDTFIRQIRRGLTEFRGAYYQDEGWEQQLDSRKVAVFSIQGWTDDLFEAVESFRMFKYLKRLDSQLAGRGLARLTSATRARRTSRGPGTGSTTRRTSGSSRTSTAATSSRRPSRARRRCAATVRRSTWWDALPKSWRTTCSSCRTRPGSRSPRLRLGTRTGPPPTRSSGRIVDPGEPCRHSEGPSHRRLHGLLGTLQEH